MTVSKDRITSKSNARVKEVCGLKLEPSPESFLIEGKHLCDMAFEAGCLLETFSVEDNPYKGIPQTLVSENVLVKLAYSPSPSGVVGIAKRPSLEASTGSALVLDRVQDPGNVGTLLRSALAFGYKTVYLLPGCANPYSGKVVAASQGAIFSLDIRLCEDGLETIESLKRDGFCVVSSALRNAVPLKEASFPNKPLALVLGNEGKGISPEILDASDLTVFIEMSGIESLNVGVAGGILMYNLPR